jgi:uncharacterized protein
VNPQSEQAADSSAIVWRRVLDNKSFENCRFRRSGRGFQLNGTILAAHENQPLEVTYQIVCDFNWRTREVTIRQCKGFEISGLVLVVNDGSRSRADRGPLSDIAGCIDVDIQLTPATNALPINRLNLAVGGSAEIQAAWVRLPTLAIVCARQRYDRLSQNTYRYTSIASGFQAEVEVDRFGLPVRYGNIWERIAATD